MFRICKEYRFVVPFYPIWWLFLVIINFHPKIYFNQWYFRWCDGFLKQNTASCTRYCICYRRLVYQLLIIYCRTCPLHFTRIERNCDIIPAQLAQHIKKILSSNSCNDLRSQSVNNIPRIAMIERKLSEMTCIAWYQIQFLFTMNNVWYPGPQFNMKLHLTSIGNPIVDIKRSYDRLISTTYTGKMAYLYWIRAQTSD